jgi:hypothetical protein
MHIFPKEPSGDGCMQEIKKCIIEKMKIVFKKIKQMEAMKNGSDLAGREDRLERRS